MVNENQNPAAPAQEQALTQPSASATATAQDQFATEIRNVIAEATKYTVFAIFVLYSIGFVIWHSYLGLFGISSVNFLQAE